MTRPIDQLEPFLIGGRCQWALLRGAADNLPLLLIIQAGPGLPVIHEAQSLERTLGLEQDFVVVYWDLRGCGKSFAALMAHDTLTVQRLVDDIGDMIACLQAHFPTRALFVLGFSVGATLAAIALHAASRGVSALVAVGMDIDMPATDQSAYAFVLDTARTRNHRSALRQLRDQLGSAPVTSAKRFMIRARWLAEFGAIDRRLRYRHLLTRELGRLLRCRHYTIRDRINAVRGMQRVADCLLPELAALNLCVAVPRFDIPLFLLNGRHDNLASPLILVPFHRQLLAPRGAYIVWFEDSAHMPHYEEPERFRATLRAIRDHGHQKNLDLELAIVNARAQLSYARRTP